MAPSRKFLLGLSSGGFHRLSYTEWGDEQSPHVVICVHGLARNARDFDVLAQALQSRCRVLCPDVVGRGQSAWLARKEDYAYPQYLADATALIARASAHLPPDARIDWVGTSMGALLGMVMAAQRDSPVSRLVVNDAGPVIEAGALARIRDYLGLAPTFASLVEANAYIRAVSAPFGPLTDAQWDHLTRTSVAQDAQGRFALTYDPGIAVPFKSAAAHSLREARTARASRLFASVNSEYRSISNREACGSFVDPKPRIARSQRTGSPRRSRRNGKIPSGLNLTNAANTSLRSEVEAEASAANC